MMCPAASVTFQPATVENTVATISVPVQQVDPLGNALCFEALSFVAAAMVKSLRIRKRRRRRNALERAADLASEIKRSGVSGDPVEPISSDSAQNTPDSEDPDVPTEDGPHGPEVTESSHVTSASQMAKHYPRLPGK